MAVRDRPLYSEMFEGADSFVPRQGSAYLFGAGSESRSLHSEAWRNRATNVNFVRIIAQSPTTFTALDLTSGRTIASPRLRSQADLQAFWTAIGRPHTYIDITALDHHVWAPLIKTALRSKSDVVVVYVEPEFYNFSNTPTEGDIFDLSERIGGIEPIPGFARLTEPKDDEDVYLVALLGFEGARFAHVIEIVDPPGDRIIPIVGVPGFQMDYPFYCYHANRLTLSKTHAWRNVRFASASCPFSVFYALQDIAQQHPRELIKIAPVGTKPHALGALLFALAYHGRSELIYDFPIRKQHRTEGAQRTHLYYISMLGV